MYSIIEPKINTAAKLVSGRTTSTAGGSEMNTENGGAATPSPNILEQSFVYGHPARRAIIEREFGSDTACIRSGSFDDGACLHSLSSSLGQRRESDTTVNTTTNSIARTNVNIDKVSTMTLSEFKSLLNSALSIPEEQKQEHVHQSDGRIPEQSQGKAFSSTRSSNLTSQKEKNSSVRDSSDICARQVTNTDSSGLGRTVGIKSKITKSISISKAQMDSGDTERNVPKEEYQMARPKPPSQIKREAVAKVAGAISHLVEARNEVESTSTVSSRPKTPTRPKTLLGPHTQNMLPENDEENNFDISGTGANSLMQALAIAARERPVTPSRIPKPCLTPRSKTPISFAPDSPSDVPSHLCFPPQQGINSSLSRINITSVSRPAALSRSNSNSSSVKSVDDAPVSPASSFSEDRVFKIHTRTRRLSNSSDSFNTNNTANSSINNAGRSYKDIYTAKRAASSGSECRIPPTRAVTPGPREKWTLGNNGGSGGGSFSEMTSSASNNHRRGSINTTCQSDKQILHKSVMPPIYRTSSTSNIETEQPMTITNEITFSDDEEINELIKSAAIKVGAHNVRSSSVDARKLVQQNAKENEVLIIRRDPHMKGSISNNVHYSVARRPASRGSSVDRASPATVASRLSQASSSSIHGQKIMQAGKKQEDDTSRSENKDLNRTEAWVDSTLPDNKQKPLPRPKRSKRIENEIKTNELASMPLEEIKAILAEPKNGFVQVDARILEPPAEDPEMFEKMERLFEKYREMELKASAKEMPGKGNGRLAPRNKLSDTQSAKGGSKGSSQRASRPSIPAASLKTSCSSFLSSSGYSSDQITGDSSSGKILSVGDKTSVRSSVTPGPFHNKLHISSNNSPALALSSHGAQHYFSSDTTNQTEILSQNLKTSGSGNEHKGLSVLQDLDPEVAKNPAALISKIQEILKVRPRKDENTKGPTRIPAPAILSKSNKSKSVSNLLSDCVFSTNSGSSHDFNEELPDGKILPHNLNSDFIYNDNMNSVDSFRKSSALSSGNNDYSELDKDDDGADEVPDLTHTWSVKSDSSDSQNRSETPVPKLATPLTTGRSTLISRKSDRLGRSLSQDKENMSNSQSTISNRSILSAREDEVEFV